MLPVILPTLLAGCVDLSPYQQNPAPVINQVPPVYRDESSSEIERRTVPVVPMESRKQAAASDTVVLALLHEARTTQEKGDLPAAVSTIERGLRIRPRDPSLWHQLAKLRLQQGKAVLAENLARKSNALIREDDSLQRRNWKIIASALRLQGKSGAAQVAEEKARRISR